MISNSYTLPRLTCAFAVVVVTLGIAYSRPAVADGLDALLQRLHLREVTASRHLPTAAELSTVAGA